MNVKEEKEFKIIKGVLLVVSVIHLFIFHFRVPVLKPHICSVPSRKKILKKGCSLKRLNQHTTFVIL